MDTAPITTDKLLADLKLVVADADELLRLTAGQAGDKLGAVRAQLGAHLDQLKTRFDALEDDMLARGKQVASATDDYVHDHPWRAIGAAGGVAFLLGLLIGRR